MSWFRMRRVREELEARLTGPDGRARGKLERKWYADGGGSVKLRLRETGMPDGTAVILRIEGITALGAEIADGGLRIEREDAADQPLPDALEGDLVEVLSDGAVLASGRLTRD
ncbi:MAG: hypothetical protein OEN23_09795 [Paracoccaceae bacterium]|nr:hypothetical protein [Paracoccaceae bacterium]